MWKVLSEAELSRYRRQLAIPGWGVEGQQKLRQARVLVAGAGGLGCAVLSYLAVAGIGLIRVVDGDLVELGNLNRQTLYTDADVGKPKAASAKKRLEALNPHIRVEAIVEHLTEANCTELVGDCPVVDALDNLETRHLLNRAALSRGVPLFHGAVHGFEGRVTTVVPGKTACLQCLYQGALPGEVPVVGAVPAVIGCIQATEVVKYVLGIGELLANRLLVYDGFRLTFSEYRLKPDPACTECAPQAGGRVKE